LGHVEGCGSGRGIHGGGLPVSELRDVVLILKAGEVGASGEAQVFALVSKSRVRRKHFPREDYAIELLFDFFPSML
jgi:hypothetical protein